MVYYTTYYIVYGIQYSTPTQKQKNSYEYGKISQWKSKRISLLKKSYDYKVIGNRDYNMLTSFRTQNTIFRDYSELQSFKVYM